MNKASRYKKLLDRFAGLKERGDVNALAKKLKKDHSVVSRILSGDCAVTAEDMIKIKAFYDKRAGKLGQIINEG